MLQPLPLRGFDEDCRQFLAEQYQQNGLNLHTNSTPQSIEKGEDGKFTLVCQDKDKKEFRLGNLDCVLMATGRHPNTKNIGLEEARPCQPAQALSVVLAAPASLPLSCLPQAPARGCLHLRTALQAQPPALPWQHRPQAEAPRVGCARWVWSWTRRAGPSRWTSTARRPCPTSGPSAT